ncbi:dnaJ-like protein subfamily C member 2 [Forsythia ovata]|uniref:DnaJ-like protein subfamily C member 2 n=1 Tax=Forsythia ovata TaxID=205694 RepID=A0ABD1WEK9_9LAMI
MFTPLPWQQKAQKNSSCPSLRLQNFNSIPAKKLLSPSRSLSLSLSQSYRDSHPCNKGGCSPLQLATNLRRRYLRSANPSLAASRPNNGWRFLHKILDDFRNLKLVLQIHRGLRGWKAVFTLMVSPPSPSSLRSLILTMEFLDEFDSRPRFQFQSKPLPESSNAINSDTHHPFIHKTTLLISLFLSISIFSLAFIYFNFEPVNSILLWVSISLLLGPFAPSSLTAGDIRVGLGPALKDVPETPVETSEKINKKTTKLHKRSPEDVVKFDGYLGKSINVADSLMNLEKKEVNDNGSSVNLEQNEEREWSVADEEFLKKLMVKHPVGKPGRWEAIAEGLKGKHKVESVIKKAKEMGERKVSDEDSYKKFLRDRKPMDKRVSDEQSDGIGATNNNEGGRGESGWTDGEDLALLNALKAFPKDVAMRWEKIAAAVPGKTKASCMKRVTDLKRDFRSSKASSGEAS